jgi:quercetin 2,3-dioxygenase
MITLRPANERGRSDFGWLDSRHSFSFGEYHDPRNMGFSDLRVINEDRVEGGQGFGTHPHRDMEIFSYVLEGSLAHRDSMGTGSTIRPGEVQIMSAGTGITHSEFNPSREETAHFLQIWILPERPGLTPRYDQRAFPEKDRRDRLVRIISPDAGGGSLRIFQDVSVYLGSLSEGAEVSHSIAADRHAWIQVARGAVSLNGTPLKQGDGAAVTGERSLTLRSSDDSEILLFDLR